MKKTDLKFLTTAILMISLIACSSNKKGDKENLFQSANPTVEYEVVKDKKQLAEYYELKHVKEWYRGRVLPPKFNFEIDLSEKTYIELLLLQNEIYARNGYLFMDAALRGYFNQFKWYQPVFDVPDFKVQLDEQESKFINKILKIKKGKYQTQFVTQNGFELINPDFVFNRIQFKEINDDLLAHFRKMNFAMAPASREQLFYVYDENQYQYIPNFFTTDLYLQLLHKYMASLLQSVEGDRMITLITNITQELYRLSDEELKRNQDIQMKESVVWANTYFAIAYSLFSGKRVPVDASMEKYYADEVEKVTLATGFGSLFLNQKLIDYTKFRPVGNYTKNDTLKHYFRGVKWLNSASMIMQDDVQMRSAALMALWILNDMTLQKNFQTFNSIVGSFAGDEDGPSLSSLIRVLGELKITKPGYLTTQTLDKVKKSINQLTIRRIKPKAGDQFAEDEFSKDMMFFTAGRYTFDSEILMRLVHVLEPRPKRTFPKGLDVFASLGSKEAKDILLNVYKEDKEWAGYSDTLNLLINKFSSFDAWEGSIYNKTLESINAINLANTKYPRFMQTPMWQRKNLSTSLAAWTELKHDLTLYTAQPGGAEAGEGGGPPPPIHLSYVEPNVNFWEKSIELLNYQFKVLGDAGLLNDEDKNLGEDIREQGQFFLSVSEKELNKVPLTEDDFRKLTWMGGSIEYLTFRTVHSYMLPERERKIALAADVYSFNGNILEETVGLGDEIYVIAEINGYPYITKGACFSYYEFTNGTRLTDQEWQDQIAEGKIPNKPIWLKELYTNTPSLESKPGYSF